VMPGDQYMRTVLMAQSMAKVYALPLGDQ